MAEYQIQDLSFRSPVLFYGTTTRNRIELHVDVTVYIGKNNCTDFISFRICISMNSVCINMISVFLMACLVPLIVMKIIF